MALIKCPECDRENVSDSAISCPNCGYGIKEHFDKIKKEETEKQQQEIEHKNGIYNKATQKYLSADPKIVKEGELLFESILGWRDSETYYKKCQEKIQALLKEKELREVQQKDATYTKAIEKMNSNSLIEVKDAEKLFASISGWKDADEQCRDCQEKIENLTKIENDKKICKQKRIKKNSICILLLLLIGIVAIVLIVYPNTDSYQYKKAMSAYEAGNYEEAIGILSEVLDYKESESLLIQSKYQMATQSLESKDYEKALEIFSTIRDYENSEKLYKEAKYNLAYSLYEAKEYEKSLLLLGSVDDQAAERLMAYNYYEQGMQLLNQGDYLRAYEKFNSFNRTMLDEKPEYIEVYEENKALCIKKIADTGKNYYDEDDYINACKYWDIAHKYSKSKYQETGVSYGAEYEMATVINSVQGTKYSTISQNDTIIIDKLTVEITSDSSIIPKGIYTTRLEQKVSYGMKNWKLVFDEADAMLLIGRTEESGHTLSTTGLREYREYYNSKEEADAVKKSFAEQKRNEALAKEANKNKKVFEPAIGMTATEVRNSTWGEPKEINKTTFAWGTHEQWCYSNYRYIYFENGVVTAISE